MSENTAGIALTLVSSSSENLLESGETTPDKEMDEETTGITRSRSEDYLPT